MSGEETKYPETKEPESTPASTIKQKCFQCIKGPANTVMTLVVVACFVTSCIQVATCIQKIFMPPVTTYTHFDFNKTLLYPSVTFCRDPPYKFNELAKYGLYAHPRWTSVWANFDFETVSLAELWSRITYEESDYFVQLGLAGETHNLEIKPTIGFVMGTCYTIKPKILSDTAQKESGYSVLLKHSAEDVATSTSTYPPGYHVYIHSNQEPYTEVFVPGTGLVDYLYVNIGEEIDIKLSVNEYSKISTEGDSCSRDPDYSANECTTEHLGQEIGATVGCSGPWMESDLPPCDNYTAMRTLISSYLGLYNEFGKEVSCPRLCNTYLYQAYVTNRQGSTQWDNVAKMWSYRTGEATFQTQLYFHFNSMMVSVYEERHNYDWSVFLADLGGSVGFLLGLSVVGAIKMLSKLWSMLVRPAIGAPRPRKQLPPPPPTLPPRALAFEHGDCKKPPH